MGSAAAAAFLLLLPPRPLTLLCFVLVRRKRRLALPQPQGRRVEQPEQEQLRGYGPARRRQRARQGLPGARSQVQPGKARAREGPASARGKVAVVGGNRLKRGAITAWLSTPAKSVVAFRSCRKKERRFRYESKTGLAPLRPSPGPSQLNLQAREPESYQPTHSHPNVIVRRGRFRAPTDNKLFTQTIYQLDGIHYHGVWWWPGVFKGAPF